MTTINQVISELQKKKRHIYADAEVAGWISRLDCEIARGVRRMDEAPDRRFPQDGDVPLLVDAPYDDVYLLYCAAQIDYFNAELDAYAGSAAMFNSRFEEFAKDHMRRHRPKSSGQIRL